MCHHPCFYLQLELQFLHQLSELLLHSLFLFVVAIEEQVPFFLLELEGAVVLFLEVFENRGVPKLLQHGVGEVAELHFFIIDAALAHNEGILPYYHDVILLADLFRELHRSSFIPFLPEL